MVPWQLPVLLGLGTMAINPILLKRATSLPSRTRRILWQFGFAACFSFMLAFATGAPLAVPAVTSIAIIGFANSWGAYCQWRAVDISVSRTYLFTQADDIIAMALGYAILREHEHLSASALLTSGVVITIAGGTAIALARYRGATNAGVTAIFPWRRLAGWIAGYSVVWGVANFAMRYFAVEGVRLPTFLVAWYGGSFVGALSIRWFMGRQEASAPLDARAIRDTLLLASTIWIALLLWVWAQQLAPITVVQPIKQVAEMVIPTIIGLTVFKEGTGLGIGGYVRFGVGLASCAVIFIVF